VVLLTARVVVLARRDAAPPDPRSRGVALGAMTMSEDRANRGELIAELGKVIDDWHVTVVNHDQVALSIPGTSFTKVIDGLIERNLH
jgi:hypothetical protein